MNDAYPAGGGAAAAAGCDFCSHPRLLPRLHVWRNGAVKYFYRTFKSLNPGINHRAALLAPGTLAVIRIIRLKKEHGSFQNGTRSPAESGKRRPQAAARRAVEI